MNVDPLWIDQYSPDRRYPLAMPCSYHCIGQSRRDLPVQRATALFPPEKHPAGFADKITSLESLPLLIPELGLPFLDFPSFWSMKGGHRSSQHYSLKQVLCNRRLRNEIRRVCLFPGLCLHPRLHSLTWGPLRFQNWRQLHCAQIWP